MYIIHVDLADDGPGGGVWGLRSGASRLVLHRSRMRAYYVAIVSLKLSRTTGRLSPPLRGPDTTAGGALVSTGRVHVLMALLRHVQKCHAQVLLIEHTYRIEQCVASRIAIGLIKAAPCRLHDDTSHADTCLHLYVSRQQQCRKDDFQP